MLAPLTFTPRFKERVWGGRNLDLLYAKRLPPGALIGESWEITDRPGDVSVIAAGPHAGRDLRWLMTRHQRELLGEAAPRNGRFPLLVKILDARDTLSLQVHPPAAKAAELRGEPKTEMWFVTGALPGAALYAGLRRGVTRAEFERRIGDGSVAECLHRRATREGDALFLPGGRVHAIGAGNVVFEIQENSDTTYRVFDWNRAGLDGRPRELHIHESLASIDFEDFEPPLAGHATRASGAAAVRELARCPLFTVEHWRLDAGGTAPLAPDTMHIIAAVTGRVRVESAAGAVELAPGHFALAPACAAAGIRTERAATWLRAEAGR